MNRTRILTLVLVVSLLIPGVAVGAVKGHPNLSVYTPDNTVSPGESTQFTVKVMNTGTVTTGAPNIPDSTVTTARGVSVSLGSANAPVTVHTRRVPIGSLVDGQVRDVPFSITVADDAAPGTYRIPVHVSYDYTKLVAELSPNAHQEESVDETFYVTLRVDDSAQFAVTDTTSDVQVGESGTFEMTMQNAGEQPASEATVTLQSTTGDIVFGSAATAKRYVGTWEAGESRTLVFDVTATPNADTRSYALQATVNFEDTDDKPASSRPFTLGITPKPEQSFSLSEPDSNLRVGAEGTVSGSITNTGPSTAQNAVVKLTTQNPNVNPLETEFALGNLPSGASATFELPVEVSEEAEPGPRQFSYVVTYQNDRGEDRRSDSLNAKLDVATRQDEFSIGVSDATLNPGASKTVAFTVTNTGDEPLANVNAKLFADSPLSASDDEAFIRNLDPGESTELTFGLSAAGSALPKTYSVSMDFQYDTDDGETKLSDTYQAPVTVVQSTSSGPSTSLIVGALVVLVIVGASGWYWFRRRALYG